MKLNDQDYNQRKNKTQKKSSRSKDTTKIIVKDLLKLLDESGDFYDIVLEGARKVQEMIQHFNFSYQLICEHLRIMDNRMILINPQAVKKNRGELSGETHDENSNKLNMDQQQQSSLQSQQNHGRQISNLEEPVEFQDNSQYAQQDQQM